MTVTVFIFIANVTSLCHIKLLRVSLPSSDDTMVTVRYIIRSDRKARKFLPLALLIAIYQFDLLIA